LVNEGVDLADIVAGLHASIASRLNSMVRKVGLVEDVVLTGGCAKNDGLAKALEDKLGMAVKKLSLDPQIAGAIGAALIAAERASKQTAKNPA
jgi:activator of 2-hydroxyglutaryl-CoA dehydratase